MATRIKITADEEDEVTLRDLMDSYRELRAAEENLEEIKGMLRNAKERLDRARTDLRILFGKLEHQESDG